LIEINKVRVLSKHDGIGPNPKELDGYVKTAREFFEKSTLEIYGLDFWTISLSDLLDDDEKSLLA